MKRPADLLQTLRTRYDRERHLYLQGGGEWPLRIPLGIPSEAEAQTRRDEAVRWIAEWTAWKRGGTVAFTERRWRTLSSQQMLPEEFTLNGSEDLARFLDIEGEWLVATEHFTRLRAALPAAAGVKRPALDAVDLPEPEFEALLRVVPWLVTNRPCNLHPRALPIPGVDGKWLEEHWPLVRNLVGAELNLEGDLYETCGLLKAPARARLRLLDPALRAALHGAGDIELPIEQFGALPLAPSLLLIVENGETGLAMPEIAGAAVFSGLGYRVSTLAGIPWVRNARVLYWGDIDTHGYGCLNRLRAGLGPRVEAVMMDEGTFTDHIELAGGETKHSKAELLQYLLPAELAMFDQLRSGRWGARRRLEQERIPWSYALPRITEALGK